ncbi:MAG TPA: endospore germination permease [Bacillus sp. (in: firmicutes)]|nr:endospore germination permease [Bacillus sp. (in: firmicutes)]
MPKVKLSLFQLFSLVVLFELGSAVVIGLGAEAKADAWLAILTGLAIALVLLCPFACLYYQYPKEPFTVFVSSIAGKTVGTIVAVLYTCYFMYIGARVLRDFSELIIMNLLGGTPLLVISFCMMALIMYSLYLGMEVIGRTGEFFFFITIFSAVIFLFLVFISGQTKTEHLQPFLENGFWPVIKTAFPTIATFPFGESIVFLMFFCFANEMNRRKTIQMGVFGVLFSGLLLCFATLTNILTLGPFLYAQSRFPLLESISRVNIGNFIQRLDPIAILILIIGGYFKILIFTAAAVLGFVSINKNKQIQNYIVPVSFIMMILSTVMAGSLIEHLHIGLKIVPWMLHIPFQFGIPALLCLVMIIKNWLKKRSSKKRISV